MLLWGGGGGTFGGGKVWNNNFMFVWLVLVHESGDRLLKMNENKIIGPK